MAKTTTMMAQLDTSDPGCTDAADTSERSANLQCDDGLDNDYDKYRDVSGIILRMPIRRTGRIL